MKLSYQRGFTNPKKGKKLSAKTRKLISQNHADVSGQNNPQWGKKGPLSPNFGKPRSAAHCKNIALALFGKKRPYLSGPKCPSWKGGKTPLIQRIRTCNEYNAWRLAIFKRDHFTCQMCLDKKGGNLNAHHVILLSELIEQLSIKALDEAIKTPQLWELNLGVTLCETCHDKEHQRKP